MAWWRSKYVQHLEAENARLIEENRRLLNVMMPRLGYEPLDPEAKPPVQQPKKRSLTPLQWAAKKMAESRKTPTEILIGVPRPKREETNGKPSQPA